MTNKTTMPEPVARQVRYFDSNMLSPNYKKWTEWSHFFGRHERAGAYEMRDLITTEQAEAYANERVREALEEAAAIADKKSNVGIMRSLDATRATETAREIAAAIRALILKENKHDNQE